MSLRSFNRDIGAEVVIVASKGGAEHHPAWCLWETTREIPLMMMSAIGRTDRFKE